MPLGTFGYPGEHARLLNVEEVEAVRLYISGKDKNGSGSNYDWNIALRERVRSDLDRFEIPVKVLSSALAKLPGYDGVVVRHIGRGTGDGEEIRVRFDSYNPGQIITDAGFMSSAWNWDPAQVVSPRSHPYILLIDSKRVGKRIDNLGGAYNENEVLFPPGTQFRVTGRRQAVVPVRPMHPESEHYDYFYDVIELEALPLR